MSAIVTGRVFWTMFPELSYTDTKKKKVAIKESTAKIVLLAIADSADDFGENSWQSFETIASKSSIERRSVIRVTRALIENNYLKTAGITKYGTNNFSINLNLLGYPPVKRAKAGRPKASDSDAFTSDSIAETSDPDAFTSDSQSPYPSLTPPDPSSIKEGAKPKQPKASSIPELVIFKDVVKHYPKPFQRESVIDAIQKVNARLGRVAALEDLAPWFKEWGEVSGNDWSLKWLTEWAVNGKITNGNKKSNPVIPSPAIDPEELKRRRAEADALFQVQS
jgi:hypothetical protein